MHIAYQNGHDTAVFFFHGFAGRSSQFKYQIEHFKHDHTVIAPDFPGNRLSPPVSYTNTSNPYSFLELSRDAEKVYQKFKGKHNYVVAHSYSSSIVAALLVTGQIDPDRVILISPTASLADENVPLFWYLPTVLLHLLRPYLSRVYVKNAFHHKTDKALLKLERRLDSHASMGVLKQMVFGKKDMPHVNVAMIKQPVLLIAGEQDRITPSDVILPFYAALPNKQVAKVACASHMVMLEQPQRVNQLISELIQ